MKELTANLSDLGLEYNENSGALIGQIKGYAAAVKKNAATGSFGCLFWARKQDTADTRDIRSYLERLSKDRPDILKRYKVTDRGIAAALPVSGIGAVDSQMLKDFLLRMTQALYDHGYVNCCYDCGETKELSVYDAGNVYVQACRSCGGKYSFVKKMQYQEPPAEKKDIVRGPSEADMSVIESLGKEKLFQAMAEAAASVRTDHTEGAKTVEDLLASPDETTHDGVMDTERTEISTDEDDIDLSELMVGGEDEKKAPVQSEVFRQAEREFEEENRRERRSTSMDESLTQLMFVSGEDGQPQISVAGQERPEVGINSEIAVRELRDDSNDGEDFEITEYKDETDYGDDFDISEIESTVDKPTDTSGKQLSAKETPLEADGSVPLINPTSEYADRKPSPVNGPDAVQPLEMRQSVIGSQDMQSVGTRRQGSGGTVPGYYSQDPRQPVRPQPPRVRPDEIPDIDYNAPNQTAARINFNTSSNTLFGLIGAFVLGGVGLYIWILLSGLSDSIHGRLAGAVFTLGCVAIIAGVFAGYRIGGEVMDQKGMWISCVMTILYDICGLGITLVTQTQHQIESAVGYHISFEDAVEWTVYFFGLAENRTLMLIHCGLSLVIMIVTLVATLRWLTRR